MPKDNEKRQAVPDNMRVLTRKLAVAFADTYLDASARIRELEAENRMLRAIIQSDETTH